MHTLSSLYTLETMMGFTVRCLTLLLGHTPFLLVQSTLLVLLARTLDTDSLPTVDPQRPPDQPLNAQTCLPADCHHAPALGLCPRCSPHPLLSLLPPPRLCLEGKLIPSNSGHSLSALPPVTAECWSPNVL